MVCKCTNRNPECQEGTLLYTQALELHAIIQGKELAFFSDVLKERIQTEYEKAQSAYLAHVGQQKVFAVYARSAVTQEIEQPFHISEQIRVCHEYAVGKGYTPADVSVYKEVISGLTKERPAIKAMIEAGQINTLIIESVQRIARNPFVIWEILAVLERAGIEVEIVKGNGMADIDYSFLESFAVRSPTLVESKDFFGLEE